ncbi:MAG: hypothetical protein MJ066_06410, partial [Clostridia bacterium]|nr:hypothetical protein [Clostridia bacterium]
MAISNKLIVSFKKEEIDKAYDFYLVSTSEKYIPFGARVLDLKENGLKIESIAFENGKTLYLMINKGAVSKLNLVNNLNDVNLSIKQVSCDGIKEYILFRLFLYSLNNFEHEELTFNNLTG